MTESHGSTRARITPEEALADLTDLGELTADGPAATLLRGRPVEAAEQEPPSVASAVNPVMRKLLGWILSTHPVPGPIAAV